jgi:hypothetical protein
MPLKAEGVMSVMRPYFGKAIFYEAIGFNNEMIEIEFYLRKWYGFCG